MNKLMVALTLVAMSLVFASAALATEPLAYKEATQVGAIFQHTVLDTTMGKLQGNEAGVKASYLSSSTGFAAHATLAHADMKGAYDDFNNSIDGGSPTIALEVSKTFKDFALFQLGVYAKYARNIGSIKGGEKGEDFFDNGDGTFDAYAWHDKSEIKNLQVMEAGLLAQKDFEKVHLYAGPMLQVIKGTMSYTTYSEYGVWTDNSKLVAKSGLGAVAGAVYDFGNVSVQLSGTFKEHATYSAGINYAF